MGILSEMAWEVERAISTYVGEEISKRYGLKAKPIDIYNIVEIDHKIEDIEYLRISVYTASHKNGSDVVICLSRVVRCSDRESDHSEIHGDESRFSINDPNMMGKIFDFIDQTAKAAGIIE